ncbi:holo-ACP synthase [Lentibacillus amyloliquefaciens]|uniref:Holo-[acyl-carrier-protein] synthase n=1 Tax=Lentibacillus amyloliquefaciens TaxID=1472767 RepID=A0A0U4E758_9BACI|nr:holo-ACP synthase [Lentibacillus amyloliquefaciens]ALX49148.1 4'-phosphopantetheinyl transferase [Lentibacillus amyloliquefaciens]
MIKGIGIDIIELSRIRKSIQKNNRLGERVLTAPEMTLYKSLTNDLRKTEYLAGRFAAKEAFSKAVGSGIGKISFKDIQIMPDANGAPKMNVGGYEHLHIFISITHSRDYAVAQVVLEEKD